MEIVNFLGDYIGSGGIESFLNNISAQLVSCGYRYIICSSFPSDSIYISEFKKKGAQVEFISCGRKGYMKKMLAYKRYLSTHENAIVHIHASSASMYPYAFVAKIAGIKNIIYHVHSTMKPNRTPKEKVKECLFTVAFKNIPVSNIGCSKKACESVFKKNSYSVVDNGIDVNRFEYNPTLRTSIRRKLGIEDDFVIGQIGRFCPQKNQLFTLGVMNALKSNEKIKCILVGEGADDQKVREYIVSNGLDNKVKIIKPCNDVEKYYQAFDAFVFPSVFEGFGIVALEAQISGLPMICSEHIISDVKLTNAVISIPLDNQEAWVNEVENLATQMGRDRNQISVEAIEKCKQKGFTASSAADKVMKIYMRNVKQKQ